MAITGIQLRCPTDKTKALTYVAPSAGVMAGAMYIIGSTVCVAYETKTVGKEVGMCISAHKILLPKLTGSMTAIGQGEKIYYTAGQAGVTGAAGGTLCGRALVAAAMDDDTVLADFNGDVAA